MKSAYGLIGSTTTPVSDEVQVIVGAAGTGKTHQIIQIINTTPGCVVVAFTNRAVRVLRDRGIPAGTIHSTLYKQQITDQTRTVYHPLLDIKTNMPLRDEAGEIIYGETEEFIWSSCFDTSKFDKHNTLIIDEASLVPSFIWDDIYKHWKGRLIMVGDPNQLSPVEIDPEQIVPMFENHFHTMAKTPTMNLGDNKNNRRVTQGSALSIVYDNIQSKKNPNGKFPEFDADPEYFYEDMTKDSTIKLGFIELLASVDIVVCWKNDECKFVNRLIRQYKQQGDKCITNFQYNPVPQLGDRLIAKNHYYVQLTDFEGNPYMERVVAVGDELVIEQISAPDVKNNIMWVRVSVDNKWLDFTIPLNMSPIFGGKQSAKISSVKWEYAYAITAHKAQGSGWDNVVVIDSYSYPYNAREWRYTAATRAKKTLTVLRSGISFDKRKLV